MNGRWTQWLGILLLALAASVPLIVGHNSGGPGMPRTGPGASEGADPVPGDPLPAGNPFADRGLHVWPDSAAAQARDTLAVDTDARKQQVLARLAATSTAIWLLPEEHPVGSVGAFVRHIVTTAAAMYETPVLVVYGIPGRDCADGHSAGGLDPGTYTAWVREIADHLLWRAVVILEPDALASASHCSGTDLRLDLLRSAVRTLTAAAPTYLDGGHSRWRPAEEMAMLLRRAGVESARGFSVNVSGYGDVDDEIRYADALSALLGGSSYVVDGGRLGDPAVTEWCNPERVLLGTAPRVDLDPATGLDAVLWVKPPWESDGTCRGGPTAGQFWLERTLQVAAESGW